MPFRVLADYGLHREWWLPIDGEPPFPSREAVEEHLVTRLVAEPASSWPINRCLERADITTRWLDIPVAGQIELAAYFEGVEMITVIRVLEVDDKQV